MHIIKVQLVYKKYNKFYYRKFDMVKQQYLYCDWHEIILKVSINLIY